MYSFVLLLVSVCRLASIRSHVSSFPDHSLYVHEEKYDGLTRVTRLALWSAFPDMATKGTAAMGGVQPVVYVSPSLPFSGLERFLNYEVRLHLGFFKLENFVE